jgi:hypothetical protein
MSGSIAVRAHGMETAMEYVDCLDTDRMLTAPALYPPLHCFGPLSSPPLCRCRRLRESTRLTSRKIRRCFPQRSVRDRATDEGI